MTDASTSLSEPATQRDELGRIVIFINDDRFFAPEPTMTGAELLALAALPNDNQLFLEVAGPAPDRPVAPDEVVALQSGMRFYDVPVGNFG